MEPRIRRLLSLRTCNRKERRFLRFLRMASMSMSLDGAATQEADDLRLSVDARHVLCRLMTELGTLEPPLYLLSPAAGWVSTDELNLLTALRGAKPARTVSAERLRDIDASMHLSFIDLLTLAGHLIGDSDVVLAARPLIRDAADIQTIARQSLKAAQENVVSMMRLVN